MLTCPVGSELHVRWDSSLVVRGAFVSILGCYVGIATLVYANAVRTCAMHVFRAVRGHPSDTRPGTLKQARHYNRWSYLFCASAGISFGGCGTWIAHFEGIRALSLIDCNSVEYHMEVDMWWAIASLVAACAGCIGAAVIIVHAMCSDATVSRAAEQTILLDAASPGSRRSLGDLDPESLNTRFSMFTESEISAARGKPYAHFLGTVALVATFIGFMHYGGMAGMRGPFVMEYDPLLLVFAMVSAVIASLALGSIVLLPSPARFIQSPVRRLACAFVGGLAVQLLHNSSVVASRFTYVPVSNLNRGGQPLWDLSSNVHLGMWLAGFLSLAQLLLCQHANDMLQRIAVEAQARNARHEEVRKQCTELIADTNAPFDFPMVLVRFSDLKGAGKMPTHEELRTSGGLVFLDAPAQVRSFRERQHICFVSHQWLGYDEPDPARIQYKTLMAALELLQEAVEGEDLREGNGVKRPTEIYVWLDIAAIPQRNQKQQQRAIAALPFYASLAQTMIILAPSATHADTGEDCGLASYSSRGWCRCEVMAKVVNGYAGTYLADQRLLTPNGRLVPLSTGVIESAPTRGSQDSESKDGSSHHETTAGGTLHTSQRAKGRDIFSFLTRISPRMTRRGQPRAAWRGMQREAAMSEGCEGSGSGGRRQSTRAPNTPRVSVASDGDKLHIAFEQTMSTAQSASSSIRKPSWLYSSQEAVDTALRRKPRTPSRLTVHASQEEAGFMDDLLLCFDGAFSCCDRGHVINGVPVVCDKELIKPVALRLYGTLYQNKSLNVRDAILGLADIIWPASVFADDELQIMREVCRSTQTRPAVRTAATRVVPLNKDNVEDSGGGPDAAALGLKE